MLSRIGGLQKTSFIDYPGKISCVIFLSGCTFNCPYCHNPSLIDGRQKAAIPVDAVMDFLCERRGFLEGVVISGGEPTLSPGLIPFCKEIKRLGYPIKLDTNGSRPEVLSPIIQEGLVDYIAMDVKTIPELYSTFIKKGFTGKEIVQSIHLIKEAGIDYEFRTTCVRPIVNRMVMEGIARLIKGARLYALQRFVPKTVLRPEFFHGPGGGFNDEELFQFKAIVEPWVDRCIVRL